ncbi:MAG: thioredoxin TrxC [Bacteriovorax sp.]|nr:thioredoxin TrxC [Bacteriovorax sp.]
MSTKTFSYCMKCNNLNKVAIDKIKLQVPVCGSCGSPLNMHSLVSDIDLKGLMKMTQKADQPIVIDFWAPWCGPCKSFGPTFERASHIFGGKIVFVKINTQDFPQASGQFNIRGIPTILIYKNGKEVARESGAFPLEQFKNWLQQFVPPTMHQSNEVLD